MSESQSCPKCLIRYPPKEYDHCPVCAGALVNNPYPPSDGWERMVAKLRGDDLDDPVVKWRFGQLLRAGQSPMQAESLAWRRDVDLHRAVSITEKAGPDLAFQILT